MSQDSSPDTPLTGLEIAVIGLAARFPGAPDTLAFLDNLRNGVESIRFFSPEELMAAGTDPALLTNPAFVPARGFLQDADCFDAEFFGYTPNEAVMMDPQLRLFHECVWTALEDAGCDPAVFPGAIGLYAGAAPNLYWSLLSLLADPAHGLDSFSLYQLTNKDNVCMRVSYNLDLKGPSIALNTACSTSLAAIHMACQALIAGECRLALAGGVAIGFPQVSGYLYEEGMVSSRDGHCRSFDAQASGTAAGEGAGVVALRMLDDALAAKDYIYAVIKGGAINNDGKNKVGFAAPSVKGQAAVIRAAHQAAGTSTDSIGYIEAHGAATILGDPIEAEALIQAFHSKKRGFCAIGSVKSNFGHLDMAAGVAGFIKTVLSLKEKQIFPSLHFHTLNPYIDFQNSPFCVADRLTPWETTGNYRRCAGVSSFGIGGTNCHIILEEYLDPPATEVHGKNIEAPALLTLSARSRHATLRAAENLRRHILTHPNISLRDAAFTLHTGRRCFRFRTAVVGASAEKIADALAAPPKIETALEKPKLIFMFPGAGNQYINMGLELYRSEGVFRDTMDLCFRHLHQLLGEDPRRILYPGGGGAPASTYTENDLFSLRLGQPLLFSFQYALAQLLMAWGLTPSAVLGYSLGEYTAAATARVFSLPDALSLLVKRAELAERIPGAAMLGAPIARPLLEPLLALPEHAGVYLAIDNGDTCIVTGETGKIRDFEVRMKEKRLLCMRLEHAGHALHSPAMNPVAEEFRRMARTIAYQPPEIPMITTVGGSWPAEGEIPGADYWTSHLTGPVYFADGMRRLALTPGALFLEVGPGRDLTTMVKRLLVPELGQKALDLAPGAHKDQCGRRFLHSRLGKLWALGVTVNWTAFHELRGDSPRRIPLPAYPFERRRYGLDHPLLHTARQLLDRVLRMRDPLSPDALPTLLAASEAGNTLTDKTIPPMAPPNLHPDLRPERPPELETPCSPAETPLQSRMITIWENYFGFHPVGIDDDFFEMGGDSLKAMNVANILRRELETEIPVAEFFRRLTIRRLAAFIAENRLKAGTADLTPVETREYYPLSSSQKRLYVLQTMAPESTAYNEPSAAELRGAADMERIQHVFRQLILRHESLRTSIRVINGELAQVVHNSGDVPFTPEEYTTADDPKAIAAAIRTFIRPFDLSRAPLMRAAFFHVRPDRLILALDFHHVISDGSTQGIFIRDFTALYNQEPLPPLTVQYKDFAVWRERGLSAPVLEAQRAWWLEQFRTPAPILELPADFPRPAVWSFVGRKTGFRLNAASAHALTAFARQQGASLFMTLLAFYAIFLFRLSGQQDIVVGAPAAGRRFAALEPVIGVFINTLPLRLFPQAGKSLRSFLAEARETALTAFDNQDFPLDSLVEQVVKHRDPARQPLFDVMMVLQNIPAASADLSGLTLAPINFEPGIARYDLVLTAWINESSAELDFALEYNTALFLPRTAERMAVYFQTLLGSGVKNPNENLEQLEIIPEEEKRRLLYEYNDTAASYPDQAVIHGLFRDMAERYAHQNAVSFGAPSREGEGEGETISYRELNRRANRLAHILREKGAGPDQVIPLLLTPTPAMIIAVLGVLKAGAGYLPLDPKWPAARIALILEDAGAKLLLTCADAPDIGPAAECGAFTAPGPENKITSRPEILRLEDLLPETGREDDLEPQNLSQPGNMAYIIFTSGSTGIPKGVIIEHRNVVRLMIGHRHPFNFSHRDKWTLFHSYSFDFSVWEMYGALLYGGELIITPPETARDPRLFLELLSHRQITVLNQTPPAFYPLAREAELHPALDLSRLRYVIFGGEALAPGKLEQWRRRFPAVRLINMYGITETTVHVTFKEIGATEINGGVSNIGKPIPTLSQYVFSESLQLQPVGVPGELLVGGLGVARGYLNRPELTAEKFIPNPFNPAERLYRSGDLGRVTEDGDTIYLGRIDRQIKIRGYRVELGEIETLLTRHPRIKAAAALPRNTGDGDHILCAWCVPTDPGARDLPDAESLKRGLAPFLPAYMIPAHIFFIPEIPLTANNKVDRHKLSALLPSTSSASNGEGETEPPTPGDDTLRQMLTLWRHILGVPRLSAAENFFTAGGDSITAIKLVHKVNELFSARLTIPDLYLAETAAKLTLKLKENSNLSSPASHPGQFLAAAATEMAELKDAILSGGSADPETVEDVFPMSDIEKGMIFYSLKESGAVYHDQFPYPLHIPGFDFHRFRQAMSLMTRRHETLRSAFDLSGFSQPVRFVYRTATTDIAEEDISALTPEAQQNYIMAFMEKDRRAPFAHDVPPLWRMRVFRTGPDDIVALWIFHHAIIDGWSNATLMTGLYNLYQRLEKEPDTIPEPLACGCRDYVLEQLAERRNPETSAFWKTYLAEYKRLPFPAPGKGAAPSGTAPEPRRRLRPEPDPRLLEACRLRAAQLDIPLKHLLFSAYAFMLAMLSHENDFVAGLVVNNRPLRPGGDEILGCFLNSVPVRIHIPPAPASWNDFVLYTHQLLLTLSQRWKLSLLDIARVCGENSGDGNPFFDTLFNFTDFHFYGQAELHAAAPAAEMLLIQEFESTNTGFDFTVNIDGGRLGLNISYSPALLDDLLAARLAGYFLNALRLMIHDPEQPAHKDHVLSAAEKRELLELFNPPQAPLPADPGGLRRDPTTLFREQCARTPQHIALSGWRQEDGAGPHTLEMTYRELEERSDRLAAALRAQGVKKGDIVALEMPRTLETLVGVWGVLKCAAAYLPVDPELPAQRIRYMLEDAGAALRLTEADILRTLSQPALDPAPESPPPDPDALAYVIYTSGSTGVPKGVAIGRGGLADYALASIRLLNMNERDVRTQLSSFSFDQFVEEIYPTLFSGGRAALLPKSRLLEIPALLQTLEEEGVTIFMTTPQIADQINGRRLPPRLRILIVGADVLHGGHISELTRQTTVYNFYGPTEITVAATYYQCQGDPAERIPIGQPREHNAIYILDNRGDLLPMGAAGEICIAGSGVAVGYLNRPELTHGKFRLHNFPAPERATRLYRSGDLGAWRDDGNLLFLGRIDRQVKIRGYRIEPGEIEALLISSPHVIDARVIFRGNTLRAYVIPHPQLRDLPDPAACLREELLSRLPEYMIPALFIFMDAFPLTPQGKTDLQALPEPAASPRTETSAPENEVESDLLRVCRVILGAPFVGLHDDFFRLGGDSIKAIQIAAAMQKNGWRLSIRDMLSFPGLKEMAARAIPAARKWSAAPTTGLTPLTPIQRFFFLSRRLSPDFRDGRYRFNQSMMLFRPEGFPPAALETALKALIHHHDMLRCRFIPSEGDVSGVIAPPDSDDLVVLERHDLRALNPMETTHAVSRLANALQARLHPFHPPLIRSGLFSAANGDHLLLAVHHLIVDAVSWRILLEDFNSAFRQVLEGLTPSLPDKTLPFPQWAELLRRCGRQPRFLARAEYWRGVENLRATPLTGDSLIEKDLRLVRHMNYENLRLDSILTGLLLHEVNAAYNTEINDVLLAALALAFDAWRGHAPLCVLLEGHGREPLEDDADVNRTVGWFTSHYPVWLEIPDPSDPGRCLAHIKDTLRSVPDHGLGYGILTYLSGDPEHIFTPDISFNYLGQFDAPGESSGGLFSLSPLSAGEDGDPDAPTFHKLDMNGYITVGEFHLTIGYNTLEFRCETIQALAGCYRDQLERLIRHGAARAGGEKTLSDYSAAGLQQEEMDALLDALDSAFK